MASIKTASNGGSTLAILSMFPRARWADVAIRAEWLVNVLMIGMFHVSLKSMLQAFFASCTAFFNNYFSVSSKAAAAFIIQSS